MSIDLSKIKDIVGEMEKEMGDDALIIHQLLKLLSEVYKCFDRIFDRGVKLSANELFSCSRLLELISFELLNYSKAMDEELKIDESAAEKKH